jgi:ketosteroid isomerase-like protein
LSENVDLVRSIVAEWERGDYSSAEWAHAGIEFVFLDGPIRGRWTGREGMADANREWLSAWKAVRQTFDEVRELDGERVLVLHQYRATGRRSGLEMEQMRTDAAVVFELRDGKVVRLVHYFDRERAFADLGLAPGAS